MILDGKSTIRIADVRIATKIASPISFEVIHAVA